MRYALSTTMHLAILCALVSAACASDFRLIATQIADKTRRYTLFNNSLNIDVIEWTLHWNPNDWLDDINQGIANFDSATGVIPPLPNLWYQVPAVFPWFAAGSSQAAIMRGGGQLGNFTVRYGTPTNSNPVLPLWFTISYRDGRLVRTSAMMPLTEDVVPEPAGLVVTASGAFILTAHMRRRRP